MNIEVSQGISCICAENGRMERKYGLVVGVDNGGGSKISNADWNEVMHHLSVSQPQKEKSVERVAAAEALSRNIHSDFDKDNGYQMG